MEQLDSIDINNNSCQFQYTVEYDDEVNPQQVYIKVFSIPENSLRWFSYNFKIINKSLAKGEMMTNNGYVEFAKKGIPEKIIEIASTILKRNIISSPINPQAGNYLVGPSYKAWERLVNNNKNAIIDENNDRFVLFYFPNIK